MCRKYKNQLSVFVLIFIHLICKWSEFRIDKTHSDLTGVALRWTPDRKRRKDRPKAA